MKAFLIAMIPACMVLASTASAEFISESRSVAADAHIYIDVLNGNAVISGWDQDEFLIEGEMNENAEKFELEVNNDGEYLSFSEYFEDDSGWFCWFGDDCSSSFRRSKSDYTIYVPYGSSLNFEGVNINVTVSKLENDANISTVNGSINASEINGQVELGTVNGEIDARELSGRIKAETVNGNITIKDSISDRAEFEAVNGNIRASLQAARLNAETVNGRIDIQASGLEDLEADTLNGQMDFKLSLGNNADLEISSFNGDIDVSFMELPSARFELETRGRIKNNLTDNVEERENQYTDHRELLFTTGNGDADIEINSFGGNITINAE